MKKYILIPVLLLVSSLGLTHWYSIRALNNPVPTEQRTTSLHCVDSTGVTVASASTLAAIEQSCGALATQRGGVFYVEERDSIARVTRTHEIRGSTALKITQAEASLILVGGGGGGQGAVPAVLSSPTGTATGATTGTVGATSTRSDGTRYACATSSATPLTCPQIQACSGGTAVAGSSAAETGSNSVALTGLTTDAAHYGQSCNESPEDWDSNVVVSSGFTPSNSTEPYDLSGYTVNHAYTWPTEPNTSSNSTVSNQSQFNAAWTSGREITINAGGTYSWPSGTIPTDVDIIVSAAGVTFSGSITTGTRTRITGGGGTTINGTVSFRANDSLIDNVTVTAQGGDTALNFQGTGPYNRAAAINTTVNVSTGNYGVFGGDNWDDLIFANLRVEHTGAHGPIRLVAVDNLIVVDSYWISGEQGARFHNNPSEPMTFGFIAGNVADDTRSAGNPTLFVGPDNGGGSGCNVAMTDMELRDNRMYATSDWHLAVNTDNGCGPTMTNSTVVGTREYNSAQTPGSTVFGINITNGVGGNVVSDNLFQSFQSPPANTSFGAN